MAKLPPGVPNPEELLRKWSKRGKRGKKRSRHRKLSKKDVARLIEIASATTDKAKNERDRKFDDYLSKARRVKLFTRSELASPAKKAKQQKAVETSERVRARLEAKAAERAVSYMPKIPLHGFGRGPGRGRGPSQPKVIEIDGVPCAFYPAKAVATQLNLSAENYWIWRKKSILPDYCLIDWRGRRWYPQPYLIYAEELGRYRLETLSAGEVSLWRFKAHALQSWVTKWKDKMPEISGIKMTRSHFLKQDWHKYLPESVKQEAEANVSATGSAFGGAKTVGSSARKGFKHLRVHASKGSAPQAPANED